VIVLDNFLSLPDEKQEIIITAALAAFGRNGYKKASTADVAVAAGISKGMVFHYFGTKKDMYLFLCDFCCKIMQKALSGLKETGGDFFDRVRQSVDIKIALLKENPYMLDFLKSMYEEADPEVLESIEHYHSLILPSQQEFIVEVGDAAKFKEGINPKTIFQILTWMGNGFLDGKSGISTDEKLNTLLNDFNECLSIMKNNFYKEEYL
jgi:AcrR family transcriptional regulator